MGWFSEETGILEDDLANLVEIYLIRHRAQSYLTARNQKKKKVRLGVRQEYVLEEMYCLNGNTRSVQRMSFMSKSELTKTLESMIKHGITEKGKRAAMAIIREKWS